MATNDFLPFAGGAGANVLTQADYAALAARDPGFGSGILLSDNLNKVLRQGTVMASMLAQWIADNSGDNVVDDGTTAAIEASLTKALQLLGLRAASTTQTGVVELATNAEAQALTDAVRAVTPANLGALLASTSQKGIVQLADSTAAQALSDALKAITPATLAAAFQGGNQSLSGSGYQRLPGGLIVQWGRISSVAPNTATSVTLPIAFPSVFASVIASTDDGGTTANYRINASKSGGILSAFNIVSTYTAALAAHWFAIGY